MHVFEVRPAVRKKVFRGILKEKLKNTSLKYKVLYYLPYVLICLGILVCVGTMAICFLMDVGLFDTLCCVVVEMISFAIIAKMPRKICFATFCSPYSQRKLENIHIMHNKIIYIYTRVAGALKFTYVYRIPIDGISKISYSDLTKEIVISGQIDRTIFVEGAQIKEVCEEVKFLDVYDISMFNLLKNDSRKNVKISVLRGVSNE